MSHCTERGCEFITGSLSHYHMWEQGGSSQVGFHLFQNSIGR
jgi:hypothetical protein